MSGSDGCSVITVGFLKGATGVKGSGISRFKLWEGNRVANTLDTSQLHVLGTDASRYAGFPFDGTAAAKTRFTPRNTVKIL